MSYRLRITLRCVLFSLALTSARQCWSMQGIEADKDDIGANSLVYVEGKNGENCSGVVFKKNEILTAAHCVVEDGNQKVGSKRVRIYYTRNFHANHHVV